MLRDRLAVATECRCGGVLPLRAISGLPSAIRHLSLGRSQAGDLYIGGVVIPPACVSAIRPQRTEEICVDIVRNIGRSGGDGGGRWASTLLFVVLLHELALVRRLRGGIIRGIALVLSKPWLLVRLGVVGRVAVLLLHLWRWLMVSLSLRLLVSLVRVALHLIAEGIRTGRGRVLVAAASRQGVHPRLRPRQRLLENIIGVHIRASEHIQRVRAVLPIPLEIFRSRVHLGLEGVLLRTLVAHHCSFFSLLFSKFNLSLPLGRPVIGVGLRNISTTHFARYAKFNINTD